MNADQKAISAAKEWVKRMGEKAEYMRTPIQK